MSLDAILKTKLFIPPLREGIISRPRLNKLLDENSTKSVVFISAPAGFGKSTLLAEWASQTKYPVAWVSLDESDNDPINFLSYLIAAVQSIYEDLGDAILSALRAPGHPPIENLLNAWINEIAEHTKEFVLILDDFHHIREPQVIDLLAGLTNYQPPQLHLLLASRADLPMPYSRLRARGELIELGISDLRFTLDESMVYLKNLLGEKISDGDARMLSERTEGWIVGLHMAALSAKAVEDISEYVTQFSAQNHYIADYLMDEVLFHQPDEIKQFLLRTSVLDKFTAPLCNYVVGIDNSQKIIRHLVRSGLFTIPLDTTRTWHRYHHLFAELLRLRLEESQSFSAEKLHRKASEWFGTENMLSESIDHAFATGDYALVIKRIEESLNQIVIRGSFRNYIAWVNRIPRDYLVKRPRLEIAKIFMLHEVGSSDERDKQLKYVEKLLGPFPEDWAHCGPEQAVDYGILAAIKAIIFASQETQIEATHTFVGLADQLLPEDQVVWRALSAGTIPFLNRALGNYELAIAAHSTMLDDVLEVDFIFLAFIICSALTKSYLETGQMRMATITCQRAIDMDIKYGANLPFAKLAYLLMGELMYQAGQLNSAEANIELGLEHIVRHGDIYTIIDSYGVLIQIQIARNDGEQVLALIREMKAIISGLSPSKNALKIADAWEIYALIFASQWENTSWWTDQPKSDQLDGNLLFDLEDHSYVGIYRVSQNPIRIYSDFIRMTSARLHLVRGELEEGLIAIEAVLSDMGQGGNSKYKIESLIVKSILLQRLKRIVEAITILHSAIQHAAREGYVQLFLNEGPIFRNLLVDFKDSSLGDIEEQVFTLRLLENIQFEAQKPGFRASDDQDQLTAREIEVLACLASGKSYAQAAETLSISRNTLKTHTKRIYQKLGVNGLLQALNKAKELGILS